MSIRTVTIAHSPDTDDLFMFWALQTGRVTHPDYRFDITPHDIEELNRAAVTGVYDVTALSIHAYARLSGRYALTSSGASMAEKDYGPIVVARKPYSLADLRGKTIAVPGEWTTAFLLLKMALPEFHATVMTPVEILKTVADGSVEAGLIIHEGQIQFQSLGLNVVHRVIDTWRSIAGDLPLPLGGSAVKKSLGIKTMRELSALQKRSILCAKEHATEARDWCLAANPALTPEDADRYLGWYVNDRTLDFGEDGREALRLLYDSATARGLLPRIDVIEIIDAQ
jgi:1,4-dihydroxy-6-naphthoate synthase